MSKLLIVESPAKAKTISKYLDGKYKVVASIGHIRDLPKNNKKAIDIDGGFIPHYEISKGKEKVVAEIKALAKKADEVVLATDPDREGEAIAWHIAEAVGLKKPTRVVFHEITEGAVKEAMLHPRGIDENLKEAQEARRVLDRLVGYDLSGLIWKKVRYGLSAGRVQSPALRIIMEREREIRAFIPHTFWIITANTETAGKQPLLLTCEKEPTEKAEVDRILEIGNKEKWVIKDVAETEAKRSPRAPFITSTLQQSASTRLGFSPSNTMRIAQRLYEAGHISYMRTDSTNLSTTAIDGIQKAVEKKFGKELFSHRVYAKKSKNAQEAHEAIRPSHFEEENAGDNEEQQKLYRLIWRRTVSSQMADARISRTKITAGVGVPAAPGSAAQAGAEKSVPDFSANGSRVLFPGWLLADPAARGEDVEVPKVAVGEPLTLKELLTEEKQTEPPPRYSEAGLIKELEKRGIGRPSTYASIMRTIEERGYVEKINKALRPTDTGDVVSTFLEGNFGNYISDTFTAEMEDKLDQIAEGKTTYLKTLSDFYKPFVKDVKAKDKTTEKLTTLGDAPEGTKCPKCGSSMVIKLGRGGKFLSCSRFPDCDGMMNLDGTEIPKDVSLGIDPATQLDVYVKFGRFGAYVQLGEMPEKSKGKKTKKPKRSSIPKEVLPEDVTLDMALHYLSLPRELGEHPETKKMILANVGRFGPYIVHDADFRSLKTDDVYKITLERALEILKEPKKRRGFKKKEDTKKE